MAPDIGRPSMAGEKHVGSVDALEGDLGCFLGAVIPPRSAPRGRRPWRPRGARVLA